MRQRAQRSLLSTISVSLEGEIIGLPLGALLGTPLGGGSSAQAMPSEEMEYANIAQKWVVPGAKNGKKWGSERWP